MNDAEVTVVNPELNETTLPFKSGEKPPEQPKQPELTRKQIGELRKRFLTREYSRVIACGHKFIPDSMPHNHCDDCWEVFFKSIDLVEIHDALQVSIPAVIALHGEVFVKQFRRFLKLQLEANPITVEEHGSTPIEVHTDGI